MKKLINLMLAMLIGSVVMAQTTPTAKTRSDNTFTQVDNYLTALKRFGVPTSATDNLDAATTAANTVKLLYNTTLGKLRVYNPSTQTWKDAIEADLTKFYTKTQVDSLLAGAGSGGNYVKLDTSAFNPDFFPYQADYSDKNKGTVFNDGYFVSKLGFLAAETDTIPYPGFPGFFIPKKVMNIVYSGITSQLFPVNNQSSDWGISSNSVYGNVTDMNSPAYNSNQYSLSGYGGLRFSNFYNGSVILNPESGLNVTGITSNYLSFGTKNGDTKYVLNQTGFKYYYTGALGQYSKTFEESSLNIMTTPSGDYKYYWPKNSGTLITDADLGDYARLDTGSSAPIYQDGRLSIKGNVLTQGRFAIASPTDGFLSVNPDLITSETPTGGLFNVSPTGFNSANSTNGSVSLLSTAGLSIANSEGTKARSIQLDPSFYGLGNFINYFPRRAGTIATLDDLIDAKTAPTNADVEITDPTKGVILRSPNGTRYRITVNDSGVILAVAL